MHHAKISVMFPDLTLQEEQDLVYIEHFLGLGSEFSHTNQIHVILCGSII